MGWYIPSVPYHHILLNSMWFLDLCSIFFCWYVYNIWLFLIDYSLIDRSHHTYILRRHHTIIYCERKEGGWYKTIHIYSYERKTYIRTLQCHLNYQHILFFVISVVCLILNLWRILCMYVDDDDVLTQFFCVCVCGIWVNK